MVSSYRKKILLLALAVLATSCSDNESPNVTMEGSKDTTIEVSSTGEEAEQSTSNIENIVHDDASSKTSYSMPLEDYIDINDYDSKDFLTPLFLAQTTRDMSDQDRLNLMSAEYYNEQDGFKKKDMESSLLPEMNKEISKYKGDFGLKIPIGIFYFETHPYHKRAKEISNAIENGERLQVDYALSVGHFSLGTYDFEKQEFPFGQCDPRPKPFEIMQQPVLENSQNIELIFPPIAPNEVTYKSMGRPPGGYYFVYKDLSCGLKVTDENLARKIEGLSQNVELGSKGYVYYQIKANDNHLLAYPTYAKITYFDTNNGSDLATTEFTWSPTNEL